jgi:hypothetical protein
MDHALVFPAWSWTSAETPPRVSSGQPRPGPRSLPSQMRPNGPKTLSHSTVVIITSNLGPLLLDTALTALIIRCSLDAPT